MTLNPPAAVAILVAFRDLVDRGTAGQALLTQLATQLRHHFGQHPYPAFLSFWHLHLQAIPWETARQAWGLTQTITHS